MLGADAPPTDAAAALTGLLPLGSGLGRVGRASSPSLPSQTFLLSHPSPEPSRGAWPGQWPETGVGNKSFRRGGGPPGARDCPSVMADGQAAHCRAPGYRGGASGGKGTNRWTGGLGQEGLGGMEGRGVSPGGDARGASTRGGLQARRGPPGCGSARAGTHSPGPARTAVALSLRGVGLPARLLTGPQLPGGHLLPHFSGGGTLPGKTSQPTTRVSPGSSLDSPPSHTGHPWVPPPVPSAAHSAPAASRLLGFLIYLSALIHPPKY